jgi:puromycin-sensitive aminopeptidase
MEKFKGQPRLPKFAVPKRYDIRLKPDLSACNFTGFVSIDLDIVAGTNFIVLNAAELSVASGSVSFTNRGFSKVSPFLSNFSLRNLKILLTPRSGA